MQNQIVVKRPKLNNKKDFKYLDVSEETVFVDRLGNILEKGSIIGFSSITGIKIAVFVGPAQHVKTKNKYVGYGKGTFGYSQSLIRETTLETGAVFITLNKKAKEKKHYLYYEENKINKYNKICLIQKPTFYADDRDVVGALMIVDDLVEKGIIKSQKEEHQFLNSSDVQSHDNLFEDDESTEEMETEEVEKSNENLPNNT